MRKSIEIPHNCPVCGNAYVAGSINQVVSRGNSLTLHITCINCGMASLGFVSSRGRENILTLGVPTDLSLEEAKHFFLLGPISIDETLDFWEKIEK
jgi:hypothetical protein